MRVRLLISGRVQAVGFRYWVRRKIAKLGIKGEARNLADGRVEAVFEGDEKSVRAMIKVCEEGPPLARVDKVEEVEKGEGEY